MAAAQGATGKEEQEGVGPRPVLRTPAEPSVSVTARGADDAAKAMGEGSTDDDDDEEEALRFLSGERDLLDDADSSGDDEGEGKEAAAAAAGDGEQDHRQQDQHQQEGHDHQSSTASTKHYYTFLSDKAGMQGVSKEEVARIVHEASVNSRYYQHQKRQDAKLQQRIEAIRAKCTTLTEGQRRLLEEQADRELAEATQRHRSYDRVCAVVDLDAFFAAVEERDRPELKAVPFAVGGGVVCTASYEARKYGIRSAMPTFIAKRLCPKLVIVPTRFEAYQEVAEQTRGIYREYDPHFRAGSLDEAYLDLTAAVKARAAAAGMQVPGPSGQGEEDEDEEGEEAEEGGGAYAYDAYWALAEAVVDEIRRRIQDSCRITASAGIATSFMLAKIGSNERKPNGQCLVRDVAVFLHGLPVRSVGGIGRKTERILEAALGIRVVKELFEKRALLYHAFTPLTAHWLATRYLGVDVGGGEEEGEGGGGGGGGGRKGISRERTFEVLSQQAAILQKLREICEGLAGDMREEGGLQARCVTLKLKTAEFNVTTRAKTLAHYVAGADELFEAAHSLLVPQLPIALRLMGVRASAFRPKPAKDQGTLDAFLAKAKQQQQQGGGGVLSLPLPPSPPPPKRKGSAGGGGGGGGPIEAFLKKRGGATAAAAAVAASDDVDAGAAAGDVVVVVIDDDEDEEDKGEAAAAQQSGGGGSRSSFTCPVCGAVRAGENEINQHVDGHFQGSRKREGQQEDDGKRGGGGGDGKKKRAAGPLDAFFK